MTNFATSWRICVVLTNCLMSWRTCWRYDVFVNVMANFLTAWCIFEVIKHFWCHECFDVIMYFLCYDEFVDVMTYFWRHDVFCKCLTLGRTFWCHSVFLTSWRNYLLTFWHCDILGLRNRFWCLVLFIICYLFMYFLTLWHNFVCTFHFIWYCDILLDVTMYPIFVIQYLQAKLF